MFNYLISKLIPHLVMPIGIVLILMIIQIYKKKKWPILSAITILWTFSTFVVSNCLIRLVEYPWERISIDEAVNSDGIVVLSGGGIKAIQGKKRIVEWGDPDRFFNGIDLFKRGKAKRLFFTGGYNPLNPQSKTEGELYLVEAQKRGINLKFISITPKVNNTKQEAKELSKLFNLNNELRSKQIILVTSAFHMHRAKKIFEREGFNVFAFPVDFNKTEAMLIKTLINPYNWIPSAQNLNTSSFATRELIGRLYYQVWR